MQDQRGKHSRIGCSHDNTNLVGASVVEQRKMSCSRSLKQIELSETIKLCILIYNLALKAYKVHITQEVKPFNSSFHSMVELYEKSGQ